MEQFSVNAHAIKGRACSTTVGWYTKALVRLSCYCEIWLYHDRVVEEKGHIHASFKPRPKFLRTMTEYTKVAKSRAIAMTAENRMLEKAKICVSKDSQKTVNDFHTNLYCTVSL